MSADQRNAIERLAALTEAVGHAQARVNGAQYMHDNYIPMLNACLTAWEALPVNTDPGYPAAAAAFLATNGSEPSWINWGNNFQHISHPNGEFYWAIVNQVAAKIAAINDQLARAEANLAAAQSRA